MPLPSISKHQAELLVEKARRRTFALDLFRCQPHQDSLFESLASQIVVKGGNRAGKTLCASVFTAAFATDSEVVLSSGDRIRMRRPYERGRPVTIWIIAYDSASIGRVIHAKLFKRGAFKVIRDEITGAWRSFDYGTDLHRISESKDAEPLIPARYITPGSWTWEQKSAKIFSRVELQDPVTKEPLAEIFAFTSKMENLPQGSSASLVVVDEQLYRGGLKELVARLPDGPNGRLIWSSYPRNGAPELRELCIKAKEYEGKPKPLIEVFTLTTSDNAQMDPEGKKNFLESLSPEERLVRDRGEFMLDGMMLYPLFDPAIHTAYQRCVNCMHDVKYRCACGDADDAVAKILRANKGQPPDDWTRELIMDPGTTNPAVLFCTIPPPHLGDYLIAYDELYPGRADAKQIASMVKHRVGRHKFNRFIIDYRAGRQTPMNFGITIQQNLAEAFREVGLKCYATGSNFSYGSDNVGGRIMKVQAAMHLNSSGFPKLRIVNQACPHLCKQLRDVLREDVVGNELDVRHMKGQRIDLVACVEYWAASNPFYVKPSPVVSEANIIANEAMRIRNKVLHEEPVAWGSFY